MFVLLVCAFRLSIMIMISFAAAARLFCCFRRFCCCCSCCAPLQATTGSVDGDLLLQLLDLVLLLLQLGHACESRVRHVTGLDGRHHLRACGGGGFSRWVRYIFSHTSILVHTCRKAQKPKHAFWKAEFVSNQNCQRMLCDMCEWVWWAYVRVCEPKLSWMFCSGFWVFNFKFRITLEQHADYTRFQIQFQEEKKLYK